MQIDPTIPIPWVKVNRELTINEMSGMAYQIFPPSDDFIELLDPESVEKFKAYWNKNDEVTPTTTLELNLRTRESWCDAFDVTCRWSHPEECVIVCLPQKEALHDIRQQMYQLREQLATARFPKTPRHPVPPHIEAASTPSAGITLLSKQLEGTATQIHHAHDLVRLIHTDLIEIGKHHISEQIMDELLRAGHVLQRIVDLGKK